MGKPTDPVGGQHFPGVRPESQSDLKKPSQGQTSTRSVKNASSAGPLSPRSEKPGAEPVGGSARKVEPSDGKPVPGMKPAAQASQNAEDPKQELDRLLNENGPLAQAFLKREEHKIVKGSVGVLGRVKSRMAKLKEGASSQQKFKAFVDEVKPKTLAKGLSVTITLNEEKIPLSLIPPDKQLADREDLEELIELAAEILEEHLNKPEFSETAMAELNKNIATWEARAREIGQALGLDREEEQKLRYSGMVEQSLEKLRTRQVEVTIDGGDPAKRRGASDEMPVDGCRVRVTRDPDLESSIGEEDEQALMELLRDEEQQEQTKLKGLWEDEQARKSEKEKRAAEKALSKEQKEKLERDERQREQAEAGCKMDKSAFDEFGRINDVLANQFKPYRPGVDVGDDEDASSSVTAPSVDSSVDEPGIEGRKLREKREKLKREGKPDKKAVDPFFEQQKTRKGLMLGEIAKRQQKGNPDPVSPESRHSEGMSPVERSMPVHGPSVEDDEEGAEFEVRPLTPDKSFGLSPVQEVSEPSASAERNRGKLTPFYLEFGKVQDSEIDELLNFGGVKNKDNAETSTADAIKQARAILNKAKASIKANPQLPGVAITYSANHHQQTEQILKTYDEGNWKTSTNGANQAKVMFWMEKLLEKDEFKHLQGRVRIAPISTMQFGGGGGTLTGEMVNRSLENLRDLINEGWNVLGWQNQRSINTDNPYAIGGGVSGQTFFQSDHSRHIQQTLSELAGESSSD